MKKILFAFVLLILIGCNKDIKKKANERNPKAVVQTEGVPVEIKRIQQDNFRREIISNGKIESKNKSELRFKISDKILTVEAVNGQKVTKNDFIATLENELLKNQLEKAQIELEKAKIKLQEGKINYGNPDLNSKILKRLEIESGLLEAKNNLDKAQIEYDQTTLSAPFSGVLANIEKKPGDYITASDIFCTIINPDNLEVSFSILENDFDFVKEGQELEIQPYSNRNKKYKGKITEINPTVDKNGLIKIKGKIQPSSSSLLDGMHVKVFISRPLEGVIVIPKQALVLRSNREVVFTYKNGLAKWNYVELAGENSTSYAIKKGLKSTDTLIVLGNLNLAHDAKVNATFVSDEKLQN